MKRLAWGLSSVAVAALIVAGWSVISSHRWVSPVFLPAPGRAWTALVRGAESGDLLQDVLATVQRMVIGWVIASVLGIALGCVIGLSATARIWLTPTLEFIRPLPASAIIPVGIAFFGLSDTMVLGVIAFGAIWPTLLATVHGFGSIEPRLIEVGRSLLLPWFQVVWKIALPNALPEILAGMRFGLTVALILAVVGEMLAGQEGLGLRVLLAARAFRAPDLFAGVIVLGLLGLTTTQCLGWATNRLLRWQRL